MARIQSALACSGEVDGIRLISPETIDRIFEVQSNSVDIVMGIQLKMGIGYGLLPMPQVLPFLPEGRLASWGGAGGSLVIVDIDRRLTFAYVMNKMAPNLVGPTAEALVRRLYDIILG